MRNCYKDNPRTANSFIFNFFGFFQETNYRTIVLCLLQLSGWTYFKIRHPQIHHELAKSKAARLLRTKMNARLIRATAHLEFSNRLTLVVADIAVEAG